MTIKARMLSPDFRPRSIARLQKHNEDKYWIWAYYPRTNTEYEHIIPGQILDMGILSQD
jgi:hypothetical protein